MSGASVVGIGRKRQIPCSGTGNYFRGTGNFGAGTGNLTCAVRIDDFKYRFIDQPDGWIGSKVHVDAPSLTNLRLDHFERLGNPENGTLKGAQGYFNQWFLYEFWRFVFVQQQVANLAQTAIEFPPMQKGASFNLDAVKAKIDEAMKAHQQ